MPHPGYPIVLTADRILMSNYAILLDGMMASGLTTMTPPPVMRYFMAPALRSQNGRAVSAPLGVRRVEAELLASGFTREDVAVVTPEELHRAIGPKTKLVLISSGDPLGLGMNDSTMSSIAGGQPYAPKWYATMLRGLKTLRKTHPNFRIAAGGPGAWQLVQHPETARELGIDHILSGYCEGNIGNWAHGLIEGADTPFLFNAPVSATVALPDLCGPSNMGVVEVSRGCGLGCPFCTVRSQPMQHFPLDQIVRTVQMNVAAGIRSASLISEDFLRYGADGMQLNPACVLELAEAVRNVKGLQLIQLDHVNISSIARFPQEDLKTLFQTLTRGVRHELLWVNLGVETLDGNLLKQHSCGGKIHPFQPADWQKVCEDAVDRLLDAGFTPMLSLLFGMPGETPEGLRQTLDFIRRHRNSRLTAFPLFYAPVSPDQKPFGLGDMTPDHWQLFRECYALNFKWLPRMYWDNQTGAGVSLLKRLMVQGGGFFQTLQWKALLAWRAHRKTKTLSPRRHEGHEEKQKEGQ